MNTYICDNTMVPIRCSPAHTSEMESQMLFGEKYEITDRIMNWAKIRMLFDNSEGWIDTNHEHPLASFNGSGSHTLSRRISCLKDYKTRIYLEAGSEIYDPDITNGRFYLNDIVFTLDPGDCMSFFDEMDSLSDTALRFLNFPYLWGGRSSSGIDCSGLVQIIFKIHGISLPRNGYEQAKTGIPVNVLDEAEKNDLVFFVNENGTINHVGLMLSNNMVLHSSGRVRIDPIDNQGIFRVDLGTYSHKLGIIRRII